MSHNSIHASFLFVILVLLFEQVAGMKDADLLYVCSKDVLGGLLPYLIALDHEEKAVVVGIHGSLSLDDVITDVLIR